MTSPISSRSISPSPGRCGSRALRPAVRARSRRTPSAAIMAASSSQIRSPWPVGAEVMARARLAAVGALLLAALIGLLLPAAPARAQLTGAPPQSEAAPGEAAAPTLVERLAGGFIQLQSK